MIHGKKDKYSLTVKNNMQSSISCYICVCFAAVQGLLVSGAAWEWGWGVVVGGLRSSPPRAWKHHWSMRCMERRKLGEREEKEMNIEEEDEESPPHPRVHSPPINVILGRWTSI